MATKANMPVTTPRTIEVPDDLRDLVAIGQLCDAALRAERDANKAPIQVEPPALDPPTPERP